MSNEFDKNKKILFRIRSFLQDGPNINYLWVSAEVNDNYLYSEEWNELMLSAILEFISEKGRRLFRITTRSVLNTKRMIHELISSWIRINGRYNYDKEQGNRL